MLKARFKFIYENVYAIKVQLVGGIDEKNSAMHFVTRGLKMCTDTYCDA